jgi:RimJ/RimL family protein N-acetyltransferase
MACLRQLYPGDRFLFLTFLKSLDRKTWESYGRWDWPIDSKNNPLAVNNTKYCLDIATTQCNKKDIEEIGLILVIDDATTNATTIIGYAHVTFAAKRSRNHSCGFGIVIHQDYQKQQYGRILMESTLKLAENIGKEKVWLHVYANNKPALALYRKFGFKEEGRFRREELKEGKYRDVISMAKFL